MLRQLRSRKTMKRVLQVTLILIIPSFVAFYGWSAGGGGGGDGDMGDSWWARYKGGKWLGLGWDKIYQGTDDVEEAKNALTRRASQMLYQRGQREDSPLVRRLVREYAESPQRVATEAVNLRLLDKAAEAEGIAVSDMEILQSLKSYINQLRRENEQLRTMSDQQVASRLNLAGFSANQSRDLRRAHARSLRTLEALSSLPEIWDRYRTMREKLTAEWAPFLVADYEKGISPTTDTLQKYFDEHGPDYAFPDQREYRYVAIQKSDIAKSTSISTETITQYYDTHKTEFMEPPSVKPRLIQLTAPEEDASTKALFLYLDKVSSVTNLLKAPNADFAALANQYSDDLQNNDPNVTGAKRGGLMEEFIGKKRPSSYGAEFDKAALALKEGMTTGPLMIYQTIYFIKAEKVQPARQMSLAESKVNIEENLITLETEKRFNEMREVFKKEADRQTTLEGLAKVMNVAVGGPVLVGKDSFFLPGVGSLSNDKETLLELNKDDPKSPVLSTRFCHAVVQLQKEIPAHPAKFEEVTARVRGDVIAHLAAEKAREEAQKFLKTVRQPNADFAQEAKALKNEGYTSGTFLRSDVLPGGVMRQPSAFGTVKNFDLLTEDVTTGSVRMDTTISEYDIKPKTESKPVSYVVWKAKSVERPSRDEFLKAAPSYLTMLAENEGQVLGNEWLADMRRNAQFQLSDIVQ